MRKNERSGYFSDVKRPRPIITGAWAMWLSLAIGFLIAVGYVFY